VIRLTAGSPRNQGFITDIGEMFMSSASTQTDCGAHPAPYSMGTAANFLWDKAAWMWS